MSMTVLPASSRVATPMVDPFGRTIDYVRVSVTDRCDLRCTYCMAERQTFLPRAELLSLEELDRLCSVFVGLGTRKLRLTGGEPLVRKGFIDLVARLSRHLASGALDELTLTTNGTRLAEHAEALAGHGVRRINVSLDTLDPAAYRRITRGGDLAKVLEGLAAARGAGIAIKINTVALKQDNGADLPAMIEWAHNLGMEITLIETMPMGEIEADRTGQFLSLSDVRRDLETRWTLTPLVRRTGGPARYARVEQTGGTVGFITPLTHTFCGDCNRVRVTCTGTLFLCLGQDDHADLRETLRAHTDDGPVAEAIRAAVARKPKAHDFRIGLDVAPAVRRSMSVTGG
ncbi:GTP 3',8-cyclase MoaA [Brevundimonas sp.]|uniref:GTP 3',8-cyclase MoaA n=1 Tax=Brevundimonas sp. TaxID=1871086 RepID=UPI00260B8D8D|nr:GTP 3',8-cyclase MoaA [Brevundimonas sp.]